MDSRQVGRHVFLFSKENGIEGSPTIVAKPVDVTKDLPREFLHYLKTLFDILDEKGAGFIRLADIETSWKTTHGSNGLWKAVIENLRKVASKHGLLSFERLCTGMKRALKTETEACESNGCGIFGHPTKRSQSLPQLDVASKDWTSDSSEDSLKQSQNRRDETRIINKLRDWKDDSQGKPRSRSATIGGLTGSDNSPSGNPSVLWRSNSTTKVYFVGNERSHSAKSNGCVGPQSSSVQANYLDKQLRFKELEDEVRILQNGLQVIERARKWYFKRITAVQEEKLHLQNEDQYSLEQFQYELLLHKTRRRELGLDKDSFKHHRFHIKNISECLEKVIHGKSPSKDSPSAERKLLEEVELLKKDVSEKANKIALLEGEKCALIRDLFNSQTSGKRWSECK